MASQVYIGLGSNLEHPAQQLKTAIQALSTLPHEGEMMVSPMYQTQPVGPQDQADFVNAVVGFETSLSAMQLLDELQAIESAQHRERGLQRWGPRTLDLDLLLYGQEIIDTDRLQVPHPRLHERAFVLLPLSDIARDLDVPGRGMLSELLDSIDMSGIRQRLSDE